MFIKCLFYTITTGRTDAAVEDKTHTRSLMSVSEQGNFTAVPRFFNGDALTATNAAAFAVTSNGYDS